MEEKLLQLKQRLWEDGIEEIGYSDLNGMLPERYSHLPYAITLMFVLSRGIFDEVAEKSGPTFTYFQHYRTVNAALDQAALKTTVLLERNGYRALPIAASQSVHDMGAYSGAFQHKTAAVRAGLGWIGKSALFVSPQYGPRVRLCTVLTDCPLPNAKKELPVSQCGDCQLCVNACPTHAIAGKEFSAGMAREQIFDPRACSQHMKNAYMQIGRGAVCGICAAVVRLAGGNKMNPFDRTELLLTPQGIEKLKRSAVAVFGIGGVGSFVAEALARSGIGRIDLFDRDTVSVSNINRQMIATWETVGKQKVDVMRERILSINPNADVRANCFFYLPQTADQVFLQEYDYVVDAVDTVSAKLELAERCTRLGVPIISCLGTGNKLDPTQFKVADLAQTSVCPLARVMRKELKKRGIEHLQVVYSTEEAKTPLTAQESPDPGRRSIPGSVAFVPSVAGLIAAGAVVCALCEEEIKKNKD